ncbi:MAG: hypothetical protein EBY20_04415, partial [Alphaproteobacteria bacterium]|nr:hypothetical protein [Alphaproteobacteria bacterium]
DTQVQISNSITASNQQYTVILDQTPRYSNKSTSSFSFYYDDLSGPPSITTTQHSFREEQSTAAVQISGIWVLQGSIPLNVVTTVSNMGQYFYPEGNILTYSSGQVENDLTNLTTGSIANDKFNSQITFTNNSITYTNYSYATTIPFSTTAHNLLHYYSKYATTSISAILDYPSYYLVKNLLAQNIQNITTSITPGYRVYSGVASSSFVPPYLFGSTPYSRVPYDQSWSLVNNNNSGGYDGKQELMVANGAFQTNNTSYNIHYASYSYGKNSKNTLDYSSMVTSTNSTRYRYATFVWAISPNLTGNYNNINIIINNLTNVNSKNQVLYCNDDSSIIMMHYRIEDSANLGTATQVSRDGSAASTNWISINEAASTTLVTVGGTNYNNSGFTVYKTLPKPYQNNAELSPTSTVQVNSTQPLIISAGFPYALTNLKYNAQSANLKIYVRIGFPMDLSVNGPTMGSVQGYLS